MAITVINLVNTTGSPITLDNLGVTVPASGNIDVTGPSGDVSVSDVLNDPDLHVEVDAGNITVTVDGTAFNADQSPARIGPLNDLNRKHNLSATTDPTSTDDEDSGYAVGSVWLNTNANSFWMLTDATATTAVWAEASSRKTWDAVVAPSGGDYTSISAAITAGAKSIWVRTGTYVETVDLTLTSGSRIVGEEAGGVIISLSGAVSMKADGSGGTQETAGTISITSGTSAVTGSGTTFTNLSVGDYISVCSTFYEIASITDDTNLTLVDTYQGNTLSGVSYVAQTMVSGITIENLVIAGSSGAGLFLRGAIGTTVVNTAIQSCATNVEIEACGHTQLKNISTRNSTGDGIEIDGSMTVYLVSVLSVNNGSNGLNIIGGSDTIVADACHFTSNGSNGVNVTAASQNVAISDSFVTCNTAKGINTDTGTLRCVLEACTVSQNGDDGIDFDGSNDLVSDCVITNNGGEGIQAGDDGSIVSNSISGNALNGVFLDFDTNTLVVGNVIHNNTGHGVSLNQASDCIVASNTIFDNTGNGIDIPATGSDNNTLANNRVTGHTTDINDLASTTIYGISAVGVASQGDVLYHNGTDWTRLAAGTAGQVFTTQGTGSNPSWTGPKRYPNSATDPVSPTPAEGDVYYNTALEMEMRYDDSRSKWLSVECATLQFGRSGTTAAGSYYRGVNGLVLSATRGYPAWHNGTIVAFGYTRDDTDSATFEVTVGGTTAAFLASSAISGKDNTLNADISEDGIIALRNASGGNITTNVEAWVKIRWGV